MLISMLLLAGASTIPNAGPVRAAYHRTYEARMVPLLRLAVSFQTEAGHRDAFQGQSAWLARVAKELRFQYRDAGTVIEIELAGPPGVPVLGLVVHGDVQPAGDGWTMPPYTAVEKGGLIYGRGVADDKGPMVQALLAMAALRDSGASRTHTVRLLVGTDEESEGKDMAAYQKANRPPALSLVLDSMFPVVVGEKAWDEFTVTAGAGTAIRPGATRGTGWAVTEVDAGVATSIVPARASAKLKWMGETASEEAGILRAFASVPSGYRVATSRHGGELTVTVIGRAAHSGMNVESGRNALVLLATRLAGLVASNGAADLLAFAAHAGQDLHGTGLALTESHPLWGRMAVNVATLKTPADGPMKLAINIRRTPLMTGEQMRAHLAHEVAAFNASRGSALVAGGYFDEKPLAFDPESRLVRRLLGAYERATGSRIKPAIAGGATYAGRLPNAIAFGMWFPGQAYPGHDSDESIPVVDLHRGVDVLIEALVDLACSPPIEQPFRR